MKDAFSVGRRVAHMEESVMRESVKPNADSMFCWQGGALGWHSSQTGNAAGYRAEVVCKYGSGGGKWALFRRPNDVRLSNGSIVARGTCENLEDGMGLADAALAKDLSGNASLYTLLAWLLFAACYWQLALTLFGFGGFLTLLDAMRCDSKKAEAMALLASHKLSREFRGAT